MKELAKKVARWLLGDYSIYRIYRCDPAARAESTGVRFNHDLSFASIDREAIQAAPDALIGEQATYCGDGATAYACRQGERIVGLCFFWHGDRYRARNFWPLAEREAKLVQIIVLPEARGQGVAARLLEHGAQGMAERGFGPLFARIWHSNHPSIAAFERAGWNRIATVVELHLLGRRKAARLSFGQRPSGQ